MNELMQNPAFKAYALSTVVLALNVFVLGTVTAVQRTKHKAPANPEDAGYVEQKSEHPKVARALRAHRNATENLVPFFAVGLVYVLTGATARGAMIYFTVFTAARVLHSVGYLLEKQPWRTLFFGVGLLATVGMMVQICMALAK